jgi:hypothetical protein
VFFWCSSGFFWVLLGSSGVWCSSGFFSVAQHQKTSEEHRRTQKKEKAGEEETLRNIDETAADVA